ncbi:MAG: hypothetical protein A3G32_07610 [Deltaproteobacteria bacterium RIFCSPLOWO2_12_FULL_40_28]|nr:MAG: hypothetical protein A3C45_03400 [Deltaproteobacteria bacterium RIFCSPHIGHO2_02_FULL_40_28]OGQ20283.1 MAG: hypothetical protein A3E27_06505 [Deltaproteobacteria bacterium RIFCSPHIGHO2_12_FULL_40_32]OGQ40394.1 MAG: hypothetical protein A3I69_07015 [Deltaproteobacteria bacterium RIFCSPLOWO2_02_FULL_40_36]OGQ54863.1 MAG: hypothetical protein A3G32_07610 [Deltaproteobacteria bacterium RIFCSPLOWO2_12_FULL_40_28]
MKKILNAKQLDEVLKQLAAQIAADSGREQIVLVGIRRRGIPLAQRLAQFLEKTHHLQVPVGSLDITLYRDDLSKIAEHPIVGKTEISVSLDDKKVYLVDDVLFTGRTIRAAMDALFDLGRPSFIKLLVVVERNGRELPIQSDLKGLSLDVGPKGNVKVKVKEFDEEEGVDVI